MQKIAANKLNHLEVLFKTPEIVLIQSNLLEVVTNVLNLSEVINKQHKDDFIGENLKFVT